MIWIIIGGIVAISLVLFVMRAMKGIPHTLDTIKKDIRGLLRQGYDGGFLVIDIARSNYFLQLRKYIHAPGDYGIEMGFPHAKWSTNFFQDIIALCERDGLVYSLEKDPSTGPLEFLYIDFGKDVELAHTVVKNIIIDVLGLSEDVTLFARLENGTVEDILIDR